MQLGHGIKSGCRNIPHSKNWDRTHFHKVAAAGDYHILARWPEGADLAPNAKFILTYPGGNATAIRDQSRGGGAWHLLKTVSLAANDNWWVDLCDRADGDCDTIRIMATAWALPIG